MNLDAIDHTKEKEMPETDSLENFNPSAVLHSLALEHVADPEHYDPSEYLGALDVARALHPEFDDPSRVAEWRRRVERRIAIEKERS
jgi:hypothetical protein